MLSYEELNPMVTMFASKYAPKAHMDKEDLSQELWIYLYETPEKFENDHFVAVCLKNRCLDICRKAWSIDNRTDYSDPEISTANVPAPVVEFEERRVMEELLSILDEREKAFVTACGYIAKCDYLDKEFEEIFNSLPQDRKDLFQSSDWSRLRGINDIVFKSILGIKTGSNAGSARDIKNSIYRKLVANGFMNEQYEAM